MLVDALFPRHEADAVLPERRRESPMSLLRQHPQRPCVHAGAMLREVGEGIVRLAGVRRPEVRDDRVGRRPPLRQPDLDAILGAPHGGVLVGARRAGVAGRAGRAPRRP